MITICWQIGRAACAHRPRVGLLPNFSGHGAVLAQSIHLIVIASPLRSAFAISATKAARKADEVFMRVSRNGASGCAASKKGPDESRAPNLADARPRENCSALAAV